MLLSATLPKVKSKDSVSSGLRVLAMPRISASIKVSSSLMAFFAATISTSSAPVISPNELKK
jgi:hypothetical protein